MAVAIRLARTDRMAKPKICDLPDLSHLAHAGAKVVVRAKPGAALNRPAARTNRL